MEKKIMILAIMVSIISSVVGVIAANTISSSAVLYKNDKTVDTVLDELFENVDAIESDNTRLNTLEGKVNTLTSTHISDIARIDNNIIKMDNTFNEKGNVYNGELYYPNIAGVGVNAKVGTIWLTKGTYLLIAHFQENVSTFGIPFTLEASESDYIHWYSNGNIYAPYIAQLIGIVTLSEDKNVDLYVRQWSNDEIEYSSAKIISYKAIKL